MINVKEAIEIFEKGGFNDEIVRAYEYENFYYFDLRPKGNEDENWRDDYMFRVNKQSGDYSYLNYVDLILDDIADKLSPVVI